MELSKVNEYLNRYLRPQSHPIALRMCLPGEELPANARMPGHNFDLSLSVCHAMTMTRRYGWTMAVDRNQTCWVAAIGLGFVPLREDVADGTFQTKLGLWKHDKEQAADLVNSLSRLEYGLYDRVLTAPLEKAEFEPQVILVYGNPAQIWILVASYLFNQHISTLDATLSLGAGCVTYIAKVLNTDMPQFGLVGIGERFHNAQDHECVMAIPMSKIDAFMEGLAYVNKSGFIKYPVLGFLRYDTEHPKGYRQMLDHLRGSGKTS